METTDLMPLLEQLEDDIDDLEEVLEPILGQALSTTTKKMPVLDKAKLHVLITYTIESLLFSYLRLHGVNAKEHAVFKELTRVKQYFEKIKALETVPEKRSMSLNKEAAGRFIRHGLAGNDKYDLERAEREAKEKAVAQLRAAQLARQKTSLPQKSPVAQGSADSSAGEAEDEAVTRDTQIAPNSAPKEHGAILNDSNTQEKAPTPREMSDKDPRKLLRKERRRANKAARRQKIAARKASQEKIA